MADLRPQLSGARGLAAQRAWRGTLACCAMVLVDPRCEHNHRRNQEASVVAVCGGSLADVMHSKDQVVDDALHDVEATESDQQAAHHDSPVRAGAPSRRR